MLIGLSIKIKFIVYYAEFNILFPHHSLQDFQTSGMTLIYLLPVCKFHVEKELYCLSSS